MKIVAVLFVVLFFETLFADSVCETKVDIEKELFIRNPSVIDAEIAKSGEFSFYSVFKKFAQTEDPQQLLFIFEKWLDQWSLNQLESGVPVLSRSSERLRWIMSNANGQIDLERAAFVLDAIIYRPDLIGGKISGRAGEFRFVFNLVDPKLGNAYPLSLIFEFTLKNEVFHGADTWENAMHSLQQYPWGKSYNSNITSLWKLIDGRAARLRTNEMFLAPTWDLREFVLDSSGLVRMNALQNNPSLNWSSSPDSMGLISWVNENKSYILNANFILPLRFQTANALVPNEGFRWLSASGVEAEVQKAFSMKTCNGCHAGDTQTRFTHIEPRSKKAPVAISEFLKKDLDLRKKLYEQLLCGETEKASVRIKKLQGFPH